MSRRKSNACLNCGATLDSVYNFCPICGQENNNSNVSFGRILVEFFVNYFSLDSRFSQTLKPFFLKPGYLTVQFNEGKRMAFMHPVRMYLILSLFYFFVFTKAGQSRVGSSDNGLVRSELKLDRIKGIPKSVQSEINRSLDSTRISLINKNMDDPSLSNFYNNLTDEERAKIYPILNEAGFDSTKIFDPDKLEIISGDNSNFSVTKTDNEEFILNKVNFTKLNKLAKENLPDQAIYDSLQLGEVSFIEGLVVKQLIRITKADNEVLIGSLLKNVPIMMLLLLPLFALILKLLYIRRNVLYIRHLVHAIHLHCLAYFWYGIGIIFSTWVLGDVASGLLTFAIFLLVSIYAYISFRRVYKQGWFKTLVKFSITGLLYLALVNIFFLGEIMISALLF